MNIERLWQFLGGLSPTLQLHFLADTAGELTLVGREFYMDAIPDAEAIEGLKAVNELQHVLIGHVNKLIHHDTKRYPDDTFIKILFEIAGSANLERSLYAAFARAATRLPSAAAPE